MVFPIVSEKFHPLVFCIQGEKELMVMIHIGGCRRVCDIAKCITAMNKAVYECVCVKGE